MKSYDPLHAPDVAEWLAMDEGQRISLVEQYHRRAKIRLPNQTVHAAIHAVVETQIAEGCVVSARETLQRLMKEGLDRHEALHAMGSVLAAHMHRLMSRSAPSDDPNTEYDRDLKAITAARWRQGNPGDAADGGV